VAPVDGGKEAQIFHFDPYPLLQTNQAGCDTLPRFIKQFTNKVKANHNKT